MRYLPTCTALSPHYKYNYRAATLLYFSPVDKNMLKLPLKKVYKLWFPCRKWASREKLICIFQYHHPFLAWEARKYLDCMYVISLGRNWFELKPRENPSLGKEESVMQQFPTWNLFPDSRLINSLSLALCIPALLHTLPLTLLYSACRNTEL